MVTTCLVCGHLVRVRLEFDDWEHVVVEGRKVNFLLLDAVASAHISANLVSPIPKPASWVTVWG